MKDRLLQSGSDLQKEVHGSVESVIGNQGQPGDLHVLLHPLGGGQLGVRREGPVRDQREERPFGLSVSTPGTKQTGDGLLGPQVLPQGVKYIRPARRPGLNKGEVRKGGLADLWLPWGKIARERAHQSFKSVSGLGVLPAEVV